MAEAAPEQRAERGAERAPGPLVLAGIAAAACAGVALSVALRFGNDDVSEPGVQPITLALRLGGSGGTRAHRR